MAKKCIEFKYLGGTEYVDYGDFAEQVIQDDDEARRIAETMLEEGLTYPYNTVASGADQEFYQEFTVVDADALRKQMTGRA